MGEGVELGQDDRPVLATNRLGPVARVLGPVAAVVERLARGGVEHPAWQRPLPFVFAAAMLAFLLLPSYGVVPFEFTLPAWAPLPRFAVSLSYRYDALAHLFTFIALVTIGSAVLAPVATPIGRRGNLVLPLIVLLVFVHTMAVRDLVALYIGWEAVSFVAWIAANDSDGNSRDAGRGTILQVTAHLTGLALLVAALVASNAHGSALFDFATLAAPESTSLMLLLLIPATARAGLFPFHSWIKDLKSLKPDVAVPTIGGIFVVGGPYLLARGLQISGGNWPATWRSAVIGILLAQVLITALLAWLNTSPRMATAMAASSDLGVVLVALTVGTPAAVSAGLLLMVNNGLSLAALVATKSSGEGNGSTTWPVGAQRLAQIIAGASLVGAPPLLGFVARWLVLLAVWEGLGIIPLLLIALATVPRSIALLRAVRVLLAGPSPETGGVAAANRAAEVSSAAVPAALVVVFSLMPWLAVRYLVAPAVSAITGAPQGATYLPLASISFVHIAGSAAILIAALVVVTFYNPLTARTLPTAGEPMTIPHHWHTTMLAVGVMCHTATTLTFSYAEETIKSIWAAIRTATAALSRHGETLLPGFEERYYLAAILLVGVAITLALIG